MGVQEPPGGGGGVALPISIGRRAMKLPRGWRGGAVTFEEPPAVTKAQPSPGQGD